MQVNSISEKKSDIKLNSFNPFIVGNAAGKGLGSIPLLPELGASLGYPPALALLLPASTAPLVPRKEQTKKD